MFAQQHAGAIQKESHVSNTMAKELSAEAATVLFEYTIRLRKRKWRAYRATPGSYEPFNLPLEIFLEVEKNWSWKPAKSTVSISKRDERVLSLRSLPEIVSETRAQKTQKTLWRMVQNCLLVAVVVDGVESYLGLTMRPSSSGRRPPTADGCLDIDSVRRRLFEQPADL